MTDRRVAPEWGTATPEELNPQPTQGPWKFDPEYRTIDYELDGRFMVGVARVSSQDPCPVEFEDGSRRSPAMCANGRLLAEAREMWEILMTGRRRMHPRRSHPGRPPPHRHPHRKRVHQVTQPYDPWWPFEAGRSPVTATGERIAKAGCRACPESRKYSVLEDGSTPGCKTCSDRGWIVAVIMPEKEKPMRKRSRSPKGLFMAAAAIAHQIAGG